MTTLGFVLYGSLVLLPIMLQTLLGYPSLQAGIAMAPRGMGSMLGMPIVGFLIGKVDSRKMVAIGLITGAITLIWLGQLNLNAGYWDIFWPQFLQGLGLSAIFVPLTTISMDASPREKMGNATSLFNLMRNLGGSVGIAVTGTMLARQTQAYVNVFGANVDAYSPASRTAFEAARSGFIAAGADITTATQRAYAALFGIGAAAGDDGVVRDAVPDARRDLPAAAAADSADEEAALEGGGSGRALAWLARCARSLSGAVVTAGSRGRARGTRRACRPTRSARCGRSGSAARTTAPRAPSPSGIPA